MNFKIENIILLILVAILSIISIFIIKSFILPLFFALVLVYISNPIYKKVLKAIKSHFITATIMILLFLLLFLIPLSYSIINLSEDINSIDSQKVKFFFDEINTKFDTNINFFDIYSYNILKIKNISTDLMLNIPELIFQIFIIVFAYYYFSKYYNSEVIYFRRIFNTKKYQVITKKLKKLVDGIIYGQVLVRFIQAFLATIGFLFLGIDGAIFLGLLTFFAAFLPLIGTGLIWLPLGFSYIITGNYVMAMQIFVIGIIISTIDNFLMPYIISEKTNIGPVVTLISIIGGIQLFGMYGVIIGPFILGFLFVLLEEVIYELKVENPEYRKYLWNEKERREFKNITTEKEREEFINNIEIKYKLEENARS